MKKNEEKRKLFTFCWKKTLDWWPERGVRGLRGSPSKHTGGSRETKAYTQGKGKLKILPKI